MMYDFTRWILIFSLYACLGWCIETVYCSIRDKHYVNRGFLKGPFCPIYGLGAVVILLSAAPLRAHPLAVFLASVLLTSALEYCSSWLLERLFSLRWWDYREKRFQLHGRICLGTSLLFGVMGLLVVYGIQPLFDLLLTRLPYSTSQLISAVLILILLQDGLHSLATASDLSAAVAAHRADDKNRLPFAFPNIQSVEFSEQLADLKTHAEEAKRLRKERSESFWKRKASAWRESRAIGKAAFQELSVTRLVWVFFIGSLLGTYIEIIFCYLTSGVFMSRQGVIYGPFSQIYGFGAVLIVLLTTHILHKKDHWLFGAGMLIGGGFEAICGLVQEALLGSKSWDYSHHPFSLFGGRTSLPYMFFWGLLVVFYMRKIYPWMLRLVARISPRPQRLFALAFSLFMVFDLSISGLAIARWGERQAGQAPDSSFEVWLDTRYPDAFLHEIYPHMVFVD